MSKSWPKVPLKYLVRKIGSGKTPKGGAEVYVKAGVMLLRSQNVHFDGLRLVSTWISRKVYTKFRASPEDS